MDVAIVFLPLLGALIAGLFGRVIGDRRRAGRHLRRDAAVGGAGGLAVLRRHAPAATRARPSCSPGSTPAASRRPGRSGVDHADGGDAGRGHRRLGDGPCLFDRLHGARSVDPALHGLSQPVHLLHADAGDGRQFRADVLRLGRRRPLLLSADRLLVRPALGQRRGDQGLRRQPGRRFRLRARHLRASS